MASVESAERAADVGVADLIAQLERAWGCHGLDADIARAVGHQVKWGKFHQRWLYCVTGDGKGWNQVPRYTSSIDAAASLVPEGLDWVVQHTCDGDFAEITMPDASETSSVANSPAIALCIAALKATPPPVVSTNPATAQPGEQSSGVSRPTKGNQDGE